MSAERELIRRSQAHTRYRNSAGEIVPSVTTVLGVLAKPALIIWANRMGLAGIDTTTYRDEAAAVGKLAHHLIECHLAGQEPDLSGATPEQLEMAQHGLRAVIKWQERTGFRPISVEAAMVHETEGYGGTIDALGTFPGVRKVLVDFKTSGDIYPEHRYQVSAYYRMATQDIPHGGWHPDMDVRILRIPRGPRGSFAEEILSAEQLERGFAIFRACLEIYRLRREEKE